MRGVDDDDVGACPDERLDPLVGSLSGAYRGSDPKLLVLVLAGIGIFARLLDVLDGHQTAQLEILVHHQHLLDPMGVQELADFALGGAFAHRDEPVLRCHDGRDRVVEVGLETQIAVGHDADELRAVDDRHARDVVLAGELDHFADARARGHRDGVGDDAALELLDGADLPRLFPHGHVLVDDADSAGLRDTDREPRLGHGIHGRGHEGNVQTDLSGELRANLGIAGENLGVTGDEEHIVERERLLHFKHRTMSQAR